MKNIFILNFSTPILIEVVRNLKQSGIAISYWQGYRDDWDALSKSKKGFEDTVFHHAFDATKNIPPEGVDTSEFAPPSRETLFDLYQYGWHALSMTSRDDHRHSPFTQRRHIYYEYVKFWQGMLKKFKPDAIVFVSVPPSATWFALYGLAKRMNIKTIMLERLIIDSRTLVLEDYEQPPVGFMEAYQRAREAPCNPEDLSPDIRHYYQKQRDITLPDVSPNGAQTHLLTSTHDMPFRTPTLGKIFRHLYRLTFFKTAKSYLAMLFSKRKTSYYGKDMIGLHWMLLKRRWGKAGKGFRKEYQALQVKPDYAKKYVYIPLAFQPEQTTCPSGGVFDDQLLLVETVAASLPDGWSVYVKEHIPQWYPHHTETHMYRYPGYYRQMADMPNVRLVPAETSPTELTRCAQAVAVVTGTTGFEAVVRGIPSLVFGHIWYNRCEGVFRVSSVSECREALQTIAKGYQVNQERVLQYLKAMESVSIKAKHYKIRNYIENKDVSKEENIINLTKALSEALV